MIAIEKKVNSTLLELKEWFADPDCEEEHYQENIDDINNYLNGNGDAKAIFLPFDYLNTWYSSKFVYEGILKKELKHAVEMASNGYHTLIISNLLANRHVQNPPNLEFDKVVFYAANCIVQKWHNEAKHLIDIINSGLNSAFLNGGLDFDKAAWFILHLSNLSYNTKTDYSRFNHPDDLGVYQKVIDNWNTTDLTLVDSLVTEMCEYHIAQADYGDDENLFEFDNDGEFVYAYEILAWLSLRELKGLENNEKFSHPMMTLPINVLQGNTAPMPKNEMFQQVIKKLNKDKN